MPLSRAEIEAIKDAHSIRSELESAGASIHKNRSSCPFCSTNPKDQPISFTDTEYFCHRCGDGGDVIRLRQKLYSLSFPEAAKALGYCKPKRAPLTIKQLCKQRLADLECEWIDREDQIRFCLEGEQNRAGALGRNGVIDADEVALRCALAQSAALAKRQKLDAEIDIARIGWWRLRK